MNIMELNSVAQAIIQKIQNVNPDLKPEIDPTDDGGITIVFEDDSFSRELTFAVPDNGQETFFVAISIDDKFRGVGSVGSSMSSDVIDNLARWLKGTYNSKDDLGRLFNASGDDTCKHVQTGTVQSPKQGPYSH